MITEKQVFAALPRSGFLRSYVEWAGRWLEANVAFHLPAALALLSQTVPTDLGFPGVTVMRANFYGLLVGPSSVSGKTRSVEAAQGVLDRVLPDRILTKPGSPQACIDALNGLPQILFYDEFGSFLQGTEGSQLGPLRMVLTDLYDCGRAGRALVKDRQKGKQAKTTEPNPRLSLLGGVAPGLLEEFTTEIDWTEGFLARFFTIYASAERRVPYSQFDTGATERDRLADLLAGYYAQAADAFTPIQPCQGFTVAAASLWESWRSKLRKRADRSDDASRAAIHRAQGHALKAALLLTWDYGQARSGQPWLVDTDALEPALAFTELHMQSVEEIAEGLASSFDMKDQRRMYRAIGEEPITFGEAIKRAKLTKKRGDEMVTTLIEKGMIVRITDSDMTAPVRYARKRGNVIPFPMKESELADPFGI